MKIWSFAVLLVAWGNLQQPLIGATAVLPGGSWPFVLAGAALIALSLLAARGLGLDTVALGLGRASALRGLGLGALAGASIATIDVALLRLAPEIIGRPVTYEPLLRITADDLVRHIVFFMPLGAVIPEELAFRGTLFGALVRQSGVRSAVLASAAFFALWHGAVAYGTVAATTLGPPSDLFIPTVALVLVILFVGGGIMALLRVGTGALSTAIAAHWIFNAVILVGLWTGQVPPPPIG